MNNTLSLNNKQEIPLLGFGTWQVQAGTGKQAILTALEVGYKHIDTAEMYQNHAIVGQAIKESNVPRESLFITSKLGLDKRSSTAVTAATTQYLQELQLDYLDLLLIHWPDKQSNMQETLQGLAQVQNSGLVRSIGVSNFTVEHLKQVQNSGITIQMNQVELHPTLPQTELVTYCQEQHIAVTAYCPLARGQALQLPAVQVIAAAKQVQPSAVVLRWLLQQNIIAIPKASSKEHIQANFAALSLSLTETEMANITNQTEQNNRLVHPEFAEF